MASDQKETLRPAFPSQPVPRISYGLPFDETCAHHVESTFGASRVYLIVSKSLATNTDTLDRLRNALGPKIVGTRIGMKPHTFWSELVAITNDAARTGTDCLITVGAGSLTDAAKIIAWALANDVHTIQDLETLSAASKSKRARPNPPSIPVICVPTSLSGGEYSSFAGATNDATLGKCLFEPPAANPALVVLDPAIAATTPDSIWLSTGIRAVDHCVETLCSLLGTATADELAATALETLVPGLLRCKRNPADLAARQACQMGAPGAMQAVVQKVPMGASHAIGHQLGPLGVGHGETSCIALPGVCKWNAAKGVNVEKQAWVAKHLIGIPEVEALVAGREVDLGDILDLIIRELGLPRTLKSVGVKEDQLDALAENTLKDHWAQSNPVPLKTKAQVMEILNAILG